MKRNILQYGCALLLVVANICMLPNCKKGSPAPPPPQVDTTLRLESGRYLIRTKFICPDDGGFILGNLSNYESLGWLWTSPMNIEWQKEEEPYIWTVEEVKVRSDYPNANGRIRIGYNIYQHTPDGIYRVLFMSRPQTEPEDKAGHGNGPTEYLGIFNQTEHPDTVISGKSASYVQEHPEYRDEPSFVFAIRSPTDSTYRVYNEGYKLGLSGLGWDEWLMSVTARPDGDNCDEFKSTPILRRLILWQ